MPAQWCRSKGNPRTGAGKEQRILMEIIDNKNLSDAQKQEAVDQLLLMTDLAEKKAAAETMLASKGSKKQW